MVYYLIGYPETKEEIESLSKVEKIGIDIIVNVNERVIE